MTRAVTEVEVVDMVAVAAVDMAVVARKGRRRRRQTLWRDQGVTVHSTTACVFSCSSIKMVLPRFPDFMIALARKFANICFHTRTFSIECSQIICSQLVQKHLSMATNESM